MKTIKCLCGCGAACRRRFLPGHDARLKGVLLRAARGKGLSARQRKLVAALGWERLMTPASDTGEGE